MCRACKQCGTEFESPCADKLYCSYSCTRRAENDRRNARRKLARVKVSQCPHCKVNHGRTKYCSIECGALARRQRLKDFIYNDKVTKGCQKCPERRPSCLQYHHIDRTTKVADISAMGSARFEKVKAEIAKCTLLCANCHAIEEYGTGFREDEVAA